MKEEAYDIVNLQINILAGSTIDEAISLAMDWLTRAEIVSFDFNGTKFAITEKDTKEDILKYWQMAMFADKWYKKS
jgi:hypothetical protein